MSAGKESLSSSSISVRNRNHSLRSGMSGPSSLLSGWTINQMADDGSLMSLVCLWTVYGLSQGCL